ncbi:NAD-dependent succinate-semialdehyde dehydrogenase [Xanthomonas hortorum]|uniref:NAD-dependent succinate-semialdehyde dehydrogenase n=1 Tax=Xanthomonas hortorum pv. hederae TaxID=453603 RepID=A0A9X3Z0A4_9XANT|nr:NAD-dependent succinate-semialdehyde dehydrogenase [Xanthomonas hortorum]MCE4370740.1 NAD-dependent succinate-semialdehyde dehydrogenase [Xanthomonas hortorum pv. hederae]MDC8637581.1 NAD-dependent succinate-semialdehyde dehydrogenase [Xanthomonas hortorum pv. hederae]PPU83659.1 succinate-semialdehyde dehydrogenase [Xanthomonas hortorum pv. hederae]PUF00806.1 NAD-dependent succinate-semialdehyde dehydrogenase [Xanthomonas hortorum pv. hederae]
MAYQTINPSLGQLVQTYPELSNSELENALARAQAAFEQWRLLSVSERATIVSKAAAILREKQEEYAQYLTLEMGKLINEARGEIGLSAAILDYYAENAQTFLKPKLLPESLGAELHVEPIGIILGIEPWNFPYYQIARVAGPQLMVGNVLLLKHAENVPQSALAFARLFEEAGAPAGVYTNLFASIDQIGKVIEDPRVRGVTVTGSERAGAAVAERAGRNLKKVVMELGGSDPLIVLEDAPLESALEGAIAGRMFNTGQTCVASKRIIVVGKERGEVFLQGFLGHLASFQAGDPQDAATTLGPLSSEKALNLLLDQIDRARKAGAKVVVGGKRIDRPGFYLEPTVLTDIAQDNPIYAEELFGPVASFYVVADEAEAVRLANATPYGLGASVFTADIERGRRVAAAIESGMVFINQPTWTAAQLPFGGVKNSGFGRELSELGFSEFVNEKLINVARSGAPGWGPAPV